MVQITFHIGMGKTGTTSLQHALRDNCDTLLDAGIRYLGMWQELISDTYCDYVGFQSFRQLDADGQRQAADRLAQQVTAMAATDGIDRFLFSNEQYFDNARQMHPFFQQLQKHVDLRFFIWVRPVDSWLPSACAQWGILHKTNIGPIQPFVEQADRLIRTYENLPRWVDFFPGRVTISLFDSQSDPVGDFSKLIGVPLVYAPGRKQTRPDTVDLLWRAAFNTQLQGIVLPDVYNATIARHKPLTSAQGITAKADLLLGRDAMPEVIAQHRDLLDRATAVAGFDVVGSGAQSDDLPRDTQLIDHMLGRAVEIIAGQALELANLNNRVTALEKRLKD